MERIAQAIDGLAAYLETEVALGHLSADMSPEVAKAFLSMRRAQAGSPAAAPRQQPRRPAAPPSPPPASPPAAPASAYSAEQMLADGARIGRSAEAKPGETLEDIAREIGACRNCGLCENRTNVVPGEGNADSPRVMFIGEAPGADEDAQGRPFVGAAGQLLTKMIAAMGFAREQVFIANINKCRPPRNRQPAPDEMAACIGFLRRQIAIVRPETIVVLGATAAHGLLETTMGINALRGKWTACKDFPGIPVMPTFHPAYLLRMPLAKRQVWDDLKMVMKRLGIEPPPAKKK